MRFNLSEVRWCVMRLTACGNSPVVTQKPARWVDQIPRTAAPVSGVSGPTAGCKFQVRPRSRGLIRASCAHASTAPAAAAMCLPGAGVGSYQGTCGGRKVLPTPGAEFEFVSLFRMPSLLLFRIDCFGSTHRTLGHFSPGTYQMFLNSMLETCS